MVIVVWAAGQIDIFILMHLHKLYNVEKLSIMWAEICNFSQIGCKILNNSFRKGKIQWETAIAQRAWIVTEVWTGLNRCEKVSTGVKRFEQVWTCQNSCEVRFFLNRESHALQILPTLWRSYTLRSGGIALCHASFSVRCELVFRATFLQCTSTNRTLLESSQSAEFKWAISPGYDVKQKSYGFR